VSLLRIGDFVVMCVVFELNVCFLRRFLLLLAVLNKLETHHKRQTYKKE
jgi:hypothetical protein